MNQTAKEALYFLGYNFFIIGPIYFQQLGECSEKRDLSISLNKKQKGLMRGVQIDARADAKHNSFFFCLTISNR